MLEPHKWQTKINTIIQSYSNEILIVTYIESIDSTQMINYFIRNLTIIKNIINQM